ncbi:MAG: hypothetical protein DRG24_09195 [Epsilonproteobacteria bacterium]|nr:MAG: hypothetical protein DRG24_09195 [Campylobacterota bacterium]
MKKLTIKYLIFLAILATHVNAIELGEYLRINGFATVGISTVAEEGQEFRAYTFQQDGVREGEINYVNNTLFGLQGEVMFTNNISATVQGIVYNDHDKHYTADVDWAYLSYRTGFDLTLRAGKFRLPLFKSSELTYIGYARTWVRPALPFYGIGGFEHFTGVDAIYNTHLGQTDISVQVGYGIGDEHATPNGIYREFKSDNLLTSKLTLEQEIGSFSMTYFRGDSDFFMQRQNGKVLQDTTVLVQMISAEAEIHYEGFGLEAGIGRGWVDKVQPDELLIYTGAYYQIEEWRPYLLYSFKEFEHKEVTAPSPPPGAPLPPPSPGDVAENIYSIGLRYDFMDQADLKLQIDQIDGMKSNPQLLFSDDQNDRKATAFTLAVDMVF